MKPFNLQKALDGERVVTRGGVRISELYYCKTASPEDEYPVIAVVDGHVKNFNVNGDYLSDEEGDEHDLFMEEVEHVYYAKVLSVTDVGPWLSEAKANSLERAKTLWPNATIAKITWEE